MALRTFVWSGRPGRRHKVLLFMGLLLKHIETLDDLFLHGLKDILYAEMQSVGLFRSMLAKASDTHFSSALKQRILATQRHIHAVEIVFRKLGEEPHQVTCEAIEGLVSEADDIMNEIANGDVLDAAMLATAQAVDHYEIARYGALAAWAKGLGRDDCSNALKDVLTQKKADDRALSRIAMETVNTHTTKRVVFSTQESH